jgi:hypothetical protein
LGGRWFIITGGVGSIMVLVGRRCQKLGQLVPSNAMDIKMFTKIFHYGSFDVEVSTNLTIPDALHGGRNLAEYAHFLASKK